MGVAVALSPAEGSLGVSGFAAPEAGAGVVTRFDGGAGVGFTVPEGVVGFRAPADELGAVAVELVPVEPAAAAPEVGPEA